MCGIFTVFTNVSTAENNEILKDTYQNCACHITRRGPGCQKQTNLSLQQHEFIFSASVLWLQGEKLTPQPIETENSIFLYNGDIFSGQPAQEKTGDTLSFHELLETSDDLLSILFTLQGPYAFIYLDKRKLKLYFCRDLFGRRSLLVGRFKDNFLVTSVASKNSKFNCCELPPLGLFCYDLNEETFNLLPFSLKHSNFMTKLNELENKLDIKISVVEPPNVVSINFIEPTESELLHFQLLTTGKDVDNIFTALLQDEAWLRKVESLKTILELAIAIRIQKQPKCCQNCIYKHRNCDHSSTGVLFSGGVDCAILALIAEKYVPQNSSIDLINVSFATKTPDRLTGLETLEELKKLKPNRKWNFVEIDVSKEELNFERSSHVGDLIYPLNTILDDSLGCALWFASRGQSLTYKSPCRVLLVGMGADELFGGYTKHRAAFKRGSWSALNQSLEDDWQNISHRNLARDDRVVSDHGRQLRTPYLDENVVNFVRKLNCWERTFPSESLPQGVGEKVLLRSLAYRLGLKNAAKLKKRALQFGSRIANSKENANHVSPRL